MRKLIHRASAMTALACSVLVTTPLLAQSEEQPPAKKVEIIFAGYLGGAGDQAFTSVKVSKKSVTASGGKMGLRVFLNPDGSFKKASRAGDINKTVKFNRRVDTPGRARVAGHPVTYGYKQVHSILQQPYVHIGKLKLWDWTHDQAKGAKARYAPYMSDSRIIFVVPGPQRGQYFIAGWSDGGNSSFQASARDIDKGSLMNKHVNTGGGGGTSTWCFMYDHKGNQINPGFALRGSARSATFDPWGRLIIWGRGIRKDNTANHLNVISDGGGVMMVDKDFSKRLFSASMGSGVMDLDYDEKTGIFAAVGFWQSSETKSKKGKVHKPKPFNQTNGIQEKPGGGYDAYLVVWRMWEPSYSERDLAAIEKWKQQEAEKAAAGK